MNKVAPQLDFNNEALRKKLAYGAVQLGNGIVKYQVDIPRFDGFFSALSCGIIFKSCGKPLPKNYKMSHIYHNFYRNIPPEVAEITANIDKFYSGKPMDFMEFGEPDTKNKRIYSVTIFGIPEFKSSITIVHEFFGTFKVTSMLTNTVSILSS